MIVNSDPKLFVSIRPTSHPFYSHRSHTFGISLLELGVVDVLLDVLVKGNIAPLFPFEPLLFW